MILLWILGRTSTVCLYLDSLRLDLSMNRVYRRFDVENAIRITQSQGGCGILYVYVYGLVDPEMAFNLRRRNRRKRPYHF